MGINGVTNQPFSMYRPEIPAEEKVRSRPAQTSTAAPDPTEGIIDIKAIKAILYLGIKGDVYLPLDEGHSFNTFA